MSTVGNHKPELSERKPTLSKRVMHLLLRLSSLQPGRYVFIVEVAPDKQLTYEEAALPCRQNSKLVLD